MERREFLRNAAVAAGALALCPGEVLAIPEAKKSNIMVRMTPKKSIMWGTVGMDGASVLDKCKAIKAAGFEGIEPDSHMDRNEVLDAMAQTSLAASSVCNSKHWEWLLSSPDSKTRIKGIEAQIHAMEDAKAYGTDAVLLVPGRVDESTSYEQCWKRATECIKELVPAAKDLKVNICIENVWNNFLLSPVEARIFIDQFNSKYVGSYFDCGNILNSGWPEHWISALGQRIKRVHIKEFSKTKADSEGKWKGFDVFLGEGDVNWTGVMKELSENYAYGWLTTEQGKSEGLADLCARLDRIMASM